MRKHLRSTLITFGCLMLFLTVLYLFTLNDDNANIINTAYRLSSAVLNTEYDIRINGSDWKNKKLSLHIGDFIVPETRKLEITFDHNGKTRTLYSKRVTGEVKAQDLTLSLPQNIDFDHQITLSVRLVNKQMTTDIFSVSFYPLALINDINDYLDVVLERREQYTVLIAVMDDVSIKLSPDTEWRFSRLGLRKNPTGEWRTSYYALSTPNSTIEESSRELLTYAGILPDGKECFITSANFDVGSDCSIYIDNINCAAYYRGYNITVYDHIFHRVVDAICYDTHTQKIEARLM